MTKKRGFKPLFLKGIIKKMSDFKLRPFKAEPIQNPKSGDSAAFPGRLTIMPTAATKMVKPAFHFLFIDSEIAVSRFA
jgi:hypothetical protein